MLKRTHHIVTALALFLGITSAAQAAPAPFHIQEASIDSIHAALLSGRVTCVQVVQAYLNRIAAYDQAGPKLNAIQTVNPDALKIAAQMDARLKASHKLDGPLFCIPAVVKDDVNTAFMPSTQGSALFKTFTPSKNATIVNRLIAAGAIILAKTNMGEFAQGYSGTAFGDCRNAYDPKRSPSGSSCGTGVAIAANFAAIGIGEDTEGSIRGPAAHGSLVGLRPTLPLVSRAGMMPFAPTRDTLGPITRSVRDAAEVLDVIAGYDPDDPVTASAYGRTPKTYTAFLTPHGLAGLRIGILRTPMSRDTDTSAPDYKEIQAAVTKAAADMQARGAEIVDPLVIPDLTAMIAAAGNGQAMETEGAINAYLAQNPNAPVHSLQELVESPLAGEARRQGLRRSLGHGIEELDYYKAESARSGLRLAVLKIMADNKLDALLYATYDHAPGVIPKNTPGTNRVLASSLAWPALAVPGGFFSDGLPLGIELLARPFDEGLLLKAAYDYEQTTKHRHPSALVPPLPGEP